MPKGKKTSSEDISKVIIAKVENPDVSLRDIEKKTGVNRQTSSDIIKEELPEALTSSDKIQGLVDVNLEIISEGKKIIKETVVAIGKKEGDIKLNNVKDVKDLSGIIEDAFKQNQLLTGGSTENVNEEIITSVTFQIINPNDGEDNKSTAE